MNNDSEKNHEIDAAMINQWSIWVREMTAKLSEMEAKLLARRADAIARTAAQLAESAMSAMNVAAQQKESDHRIDGRPMTWLKVNDSRHSCCKSLPLSRLDWVRWFADIKDGRLYLYVYGADGSLYRVHCRRSETPRLAYEDGELWWVFWAD